MELYRKKKSTLKQSEEISKVKIVEEIIFKYLKVAAVLFFLVWYFMHPEYYVDDTGKTLFTNNRTYIILITGLLLMVMTIVPLHLSDKWNQIFVLSCPIFKDWDKLQRIIIQYANILEFHLL